MKIPHHEATTAQLGAAFPFVAGPSSLTDRIVIGREASGHTFAYDPFVLYRKGVLTNPNMVVLGQVGRGKSALVKSYLYRQHAFGRRIVIVDPKGEYEALAQATDGEVVRLSPESPVGFNPLGPASRSGDGRMVGALQHSVLEGICSVSLGRRLGPDETVALQIALGSQQRDEAQATLRGVLDRLMQPRARDLEGLGISPERCRELGEIVAYALMRLLGGEFGTMFDAVDSSALSLRRPVLVIDISDFYRSDALSVLLVSLFGALHRSLSSSSAPTILVIDEAWAVLANPFAASFIQTFFKLSRSLGVSNVIVAHRPSDIVGDDLAPSVGSDRSIAGREATGLISDCETSVTFALSPREAALAQRLFGLNDRQRELLLGIGRNVALWRVSRTTSLVRHRLSRDELSFVDTDNRMRL